MSPGRGKRRGSGQKDTLLFPHRTRYRPLTSQEPSLCYDRISLEIFAVLVGSIARVGKSFAGGLALTSRANLSSDRLKSSRDWRNALPAAPIIRASLMTLLRRIFYLDQPLQIMATPFFCLLSHLSVKISNASVLTAALAQTFPTGARNIRSSYTF